MPFISALTLFLFFCIACAQGQERSAKPTKQAKVYTIADLDPFLGAGFEGGRDFENGREICEKANCYSCHRFIGRGSSAGPDLSDVGKKYGPRDLLLRMLEPNSAITEAYAATEVTLKDGTVLRGRILTSNKKGVSINTNIADAKAIARVKSSDIAKMEPSKKSLMPSGLLNILKETDILDLLAFILSKGDKDDPMFR